MKQRNYFAKAMVCALFMCATIPASGRVIQVEQLPESAKTFIDKTFPDQKIVLAERGFKRYEVRLNNGTKIDFDTNGAWAKVKCRMSPVPAELVPQFVARYVQENFSDFAITKINKQRNGYDVKLSNGLNLLFNKNGELVSTGY